MGRIKTAKYDELVWLRNFVNAKFKLRRLPTVLVQFSDYLYRSALCVEISWAGKKLKYERTQTSHSCFRFLSTKILTVRCFLR